MLSLLPAPPARGYGEEDVPALVEPPLAPDPPDLDCRAAVLMEWTTGTVLYARRAWEQHDPASLTKVMTAIVALERGSLPEPVTVSRNAAWMSGSVMGLREGDEYSLRDLLYGLLLESGNDAAVAIAEHIAGDESSFALLMNEKAHALGALSTRFRNAHGLTEPGHYSTAYDLALIFRYAMSLPLFAEIAGSIQKEVTRLGPSAAGSSVYNTNRLLGVYPGMEGGKTGTTAAAGACLAASAARDGMRLVSVVLDAGDRWEETRRLLDWGFEHYALAWGGRAGDYYGSLPVRGGTSRRVDLVLAGDLVGVVRRSELRAVRVEAQVAREVPGPVRKGQPLGRLALVAGDRTAAEAVLVAREDVPRATLLRRVWGVLLPALRRLHRAGLT